MMKKFLIFSVILFFFTEFKTQNSFRIIDNVLVHGSNSKKMAVITTSENNKTVITFPNIDIQGMSFKYLRQIYPKYKTEYDEWMFKDSIKFNANELTVNDYRVGTYKIEKYPAKNIIKVSCVIESRNISTEYLIHCAKIEFEKIDFLTKKPAKIKVNYEKNYNLGDQRRSQEFIKKQQEKKSKEKLRIERFYAQVYDKLNGELDPIEGIYKSIDQGEGVEYDIAIFKSYKNNREYVGLVISTTDKDLSIGAKILTFEKTAQANLFFGKYITKNGKSFDNKTASLNGALLKMGVKSFIKMFPAEGENRSYLEINPMVDWQSSGSGVLINNKGFIATNNHVVKNAKKIRISFQNDTTNYEADIISQNEKNDVAIIQIIDTRFVSNLKPINWNNSISLGEKVFTLGYPISNKMSDNVKVVDGIVSGLNGKGGDDSFFQTTLPVWYGNSGGPCFNSKGEIIGLATQILWDQGEKVDNVAYITKTSNILKLSNNIIISKNIQNNNLNSIKFENLIENLIPYSAFIKINY